MYNFVSLNKKLLACCLFISSFIVTLEIKAQIVAQDSLALVDLYNSTNGSGWTNHTNWLTTAPVSTWYGIEAIGNRVTNIDFGYTGNNLTGNIPISIGNLTNLQELILASNNLTGLIPSSIGNLTNLTALTLQDNQLNGSIPSSIGNLIHIKNLWFHNNQLSGSIPLSFINLPKAALIVIYNNNLTYFGLEQLVSGNFNIYYSPQGKIPVAQSANKLTVSVGGTPSNNTFKWYKDTVLIATNIGDSSFTPTGFVKYSVVVTNSVCNQLTLHSDTLYPPSTNINDSLALVDLYNSTNGDGWFNHTNWLTSAPVSTWYGVDVANGRVTKLSFNENNNNLLGPIPESLGDLSELTYLNLGENKLNGSLPKSMGNLIKAEEIYLWNNNLSGSIPESIGNLSNLRILTLYNNNISGQLPESMGNMTNLQVLGLPLNNLTGNIPNSFGNLTNLTDLILFNNQLSGSIPSSIGNLSKLTNCWLSNNLLSGSLPSTINNLPSAAHIQLDNNKFTFSGIEELLPAYANLIYTPQAKILVSKYNNKLSISAGGTLANNTYKWYNDTTLVATIIGDSSFTPINFGKYSVAVTNTVATKLTLYSDTVLVNNLSIEICNPFGNASLISNISGDNYQWQLSMDGMTFNNIADNSNYTGSNASNLQLNNIPSSLYGYQYRCVVDGNNSGVYTLQFKNSWLGSSANSEWRTASNWGCGNIPDANTDVIINSGNIIVTENTSCRSLTVKPTANITINSGVTLTVLH